MGNDPPKARKTLNRKQRYRSLDYSNSNPYSNGQNNESTIRYGSKEYKVKQNNSFETPPIQKTPAPKRKTDNQQDRSIGKAIINMGVNKSKLEKLADFHELSSPGYYYNAKDKDRILQNLSKKNQQLRKQLKIISDDLTEKLKKKKLVPKKKDKDGQILQAMAETEQYKDYTKRIKDNLQSAYRQIDMYKRRIADMKSKSQGFEADQRVKILQNNITAADLQIQKYTKKIQGIINITKGQDLHIEKDLNEQKKMGLQNYKKESQYIKNKIKQFAAQDRIKESDYKKQQAYLCDLQKKYRELNGSYFPDLSNTIRKQQPKTASSQVNAKQFAQAAQQAKNLKKRHEQYNLKIQLMLQQRSKRMQEQRQVNDQIAYKDRVIEALKHKIQRINLLLRPRKGSLFGLDGQSNHGTQLASDIDQLQINRRLDEQLHQDQFDIKHLMANIPKPIRKRPQLNAVNNESVKTDIKIENQKSQPKKWGAISTRIQKRGKHFKQQKTFQDKTHLQPNTFPIIVGVNVWVNRNNTILAIQAIYMNKNKDIKYGSKSSDPIMGGGIAKRFDLQTPDYLKNITLTVTKEGFVQSMTFSSKEGKIGKFGNKRASDENISLGLASNERPFLFFGASVVNQQQQSRLNFFGIQICDE